LWIVITLAVTASILLQGVRGGRLPWPAAVLDPLALALLLGGLALRWTAILTLGRHFTVNVAISSDHRLVRTGPYRVVRHPSYTGLLIAFLGMGLAFHNGWSLAVLLVPVGAALAHRISVEERALREAFGAEYEDYAAHTWRLVPWIH
jgi:protein-S-isoprenylcysteine O-methyltransferase